VFEKGGIRMALVFWFFVAVYIASKLPPFWAEVFIILLLAINIRRGINEGLKRNK